MRECRAAWRGMTLGERAGVLSSSDGMSVTKYVLEKSEQRRLVQHGSTAPSGGNE